MVALSHQLREFVFISNLKGPPIINASSHNQLLQLEQIITNKEIFIRQYRKQISSLLWFADVNEFEGISMA